MSNNKPGKSKHACVVCGQLAVWEYMPGDGGGGDFFCEGHVSRGCSCNYDPETGIEERDEQGRQLPCCEYAHSGEGFDRNET